ncbi:MAG: FHA domain-containing protein [Anaerolineae bacterium]|nr:FHA domain-containing protein [Anaerolineae bacterium]
MAMYDDEPTMMGSGRPSATLVIRQGPQAGMSFPLTGNQAVMGREEGLEIVLQDPESSRRHARVYWQAGHYIIEDMGSTNGTFVNGIQITGPQFLNAGDSIGIGQTALVFQVASGGPSNVAPQYQPAPVQAPPAGVPASGGSSDNKWTQYALYGCGCLLLVTICVLLTIAFLIILYPETLDGLSQVGYDALVLAHMVVNFM